MSLLLNSLGIDVFGYSLNYEKGALFDKLKVSSLVDGCFNDILDKESLHKSLVQCNPQVVVHFAAQPLVLDSYKKPYETFQVNTYGTLNVLEAACQVESVQVILVITTDKVYRNLEEGIRFCETDPLEGSDPYSASKVAAESICHAWQKMHPEHSKKRVIVARAGNVIGGGDTANNRLIPDLVRGFSFDEPVVIRNPRSVRPWQHVLDPLFGYLLYIQKSLNDKASPSAMNFGPLEPGKTVQEIVDISSSYFNVKVQEHQKSQSHFSEAGRLELDSTLAQRELGWVPKWNQDIAVHKTFSWWKRVLIDQVPELDACLEDLESFLGK